MLDFITWTVSKELFSIGPLTVRWYGLMFALGFYLGYQIVEKMFKHEGIRLEWLEKLFIYVIVATVVGARFGHVFFYSWEYYSQHPGEILKIWHGGLASHGGAIGILIAIYLFSRNVTKKPMLWTLDRLAVPVALAAMFIRVGNLFNSEIYGNVTSLPWGFIFANEGETVPKHPTQIYEALCYLATFGVLMFQYWRTNAKEMTGRIFGIFLIGIFLSRFFIEFIKEDQEVFEAGMILNMGQLLSIPFVLAGLFLLIRSFSIKKA